MWAHYADGHRGVCLEFNVQNEVICCALEVQYFSKYPMTRQYSDNLAENLLPLLATSGFLKLPDGALRPIIAGCQGSYDAVQDLVRKCNVDIPVLRARKFDNRYALEITT